MVSVYKSVLASPFQFSSAIADYKDERSHIQSTVQSDSDNETGHFQFRSLSSNAIDNSVLKLKLEIPAKR